MSSSSSSSTSTVVVVVVLVVVTIIVHCNAAGRRKSEPSVNRLRRVCSVHSLSFAHIFFTLKINTIFFIYKGEQAQGSPPKYASAIFHLAEIARITEYRGHHQLEVKNQSLGSRGHIIFICRI